MNIQEAANYLGYTNTQYLRKLVRDGKIETKMVPVAEGSKTLRHDFDKKTLEAFKALPRVSVAHRRSDGRSKWTLYATPEELASIKKAAPTAIVQKPKAYSKKAKAKTAA